MTATKNYRVDSFIAGLGIKAPCVAVAISPITLSGEQTVNGVAVVVGDRVLVTNQPFYVDNGIYVVETSDWTRAGDFDGNRDVVNGTQVVIATATVGRHPLWQVNTANPITIGTTPLTFVSSDGPNVSYDLEQDEVDMGLTANDIDDSYLPGNALRYGTNTIPLTTDMTTAIQTAVNVASWSGRRAYVPAGDYLFSQLYLYYDSTNNQGYNDTGSKAGPLIFEGDGAMHANHVTSGVTAGTYLQSSETSYNAVLLDAPSGGSSANQARIQIKNMSFKAATDGYVLQLNEFQDECLLEDVFVYNAGTGGGITMDNYWYSQFRRVLVLGQHIAFYRKPNDCTGIGWRLQTQGGSHTKFEHCSSRGFDVAWSGGDSNTLTKELTFEHCQSIVCNYGWQVNAECEGTVIRKCNSELITYRAIQTVGAVEGFRVDGGQYIGVLGEWIASQAYALNETVHNDSGKIYICTSAGTSAGSGGPTGTGTGITDNTCEWDYVVASAESDFATIELDTDTIYPVIEHAKIRVPEGGSGVKLVEDNSMHPQINNNVFGVNFSGVTNGTCINANGSTLGGQGRAVHNQNLGALIDMFDTENAFSEYSDPVALVVQHRVGAVAIAATIPVSNNKFVKVSGTGTTITALSPVNKGREVTISIGNSGQTMTHSATLNLAGDTDWVTAAANESRHFWCDGTNWIQVE